MPRDARAGKPQLEIKRILVPTDFSSRAEPALRWASALAGVFNAEMLLLRVLDILLAAMAGLPAQMAAMPSSG